MKPRTMIAVALLSLLVTATPASAGSVDWSGPMYPMDGTTVVFGEPIQGAKATYTNGADAVAFTVDAKQLEERHGYTIWLMVFNHPENCLGSDAPEGLLCGQQDHFNPAAMFSVMYGTGKWANGAAVRFEGTRQANTPLDIPPDVWLGVGLVNPGGAEVHLRVRDHGPPQGSNADDQVRTIGGGCTQESAPLGPGARGNYQCADIHTTAS